jgi:hypothetical protein
VSGTIHRLLRPHSAAARRIKPLRLPDAGGACRIPDNDHRTQAKPQPGPGWGNHGLPKSQQFELSAKQLERVIFTRDRYYVIITF